MDARRALAFLGGLGGAVGGAAVLSPVCWREQRGGVEGREAHSGHRMRKEYTHWQGRKRDGEAQCERAWAFQGEKNHTTEGDSNGVRRRGVWAMPPQEPLDRGRGWWLLCHRQALGCLAEAQQGPPRLWPNQASQRPQLAQTKP